MTNNTDSDLASSDRDDASKKTCQTDLPISMTMLNKSLDNEEDENKSSNNSCSVSSSSQSNANSNITSSNTKNTETLTNEVENIIGHLGPYQLLIICCVLLMKISQGVNGSLPVFVAANVDYRCETIFDQNNDTCGKILNLKENENWAENYFHSTESSCGGKEIDKCKVDRSALPLYDNDFSPFSSEKSCENYLHEHGNGKNSSSQVSCTSFIYDRSTYKETIISEFNLVCNRAYLTDITNSIYYVGYSFGAIAAGIVSSNYGRKIAGLSASALMIAAAFYSAAVPTIQQYMFSRFLVGFFVSAFAVANFTYCMEISGKKARTLVNLYWGCMFSLGCVLLSYPFALKFRHWRDLQYAVAFLGFPGVILCYFFQVESWRWLVTKNRPNEAAKIAIKLAKKQNKNSLGKSISRKQIDKIEQNLYDIANSNSRNLQIRDSSDKNSLLSQDSNSAQNSKSNQSEESPFYKIVKHKCIFLITLNLGFNWFVNSLVYYGLVLNAGNLPGSDLANNAINGLMDLIGYFSMILLVDRPEIGRKKYLAYCLLISGFTCTISTILMQINKNSCDNHQHFNQLGLILVYIGKAAVCGSFQIILQYTTEIYSTDIRASGLAVCSVFARVGGICAPFIVSLSRVQANLPGFVFGIFGVLAGLLSFYLPETIGKPLLFTVEEAKREYTYAKDADSEKGSTSSRVSIF